MLSRDQPFAPALVPRTSEAGSRVRAFSDEDRAFRKELISWLRFNDASAIETGDGLAGRTSGQPSVPDWLGRIAIGVILTGRSQARTDERNIRSSPFIAVFVARENATRSWIEAGRAYERFALRATVLELRNAFINQPIEVRRLRPQLYRLLGLQDEYALLMVRVGYGPRAPSSLRRPVRDVVIQS